MGVSNRNGVRTLGLQALDRSRGQSLQPQWVGIDKQNTDHLVEA